MGTQFQEFKKNITAVCKDVKRAESASAMATENANELPLLRAEVDELKKQNKKLKRAHYCARRSTCAQN